MAKVAFAHFQEALLNHFAAEETVLFPSSNRAPACTSDQPRVMRGEHAQMRQLLSAAAAALAEHDADDYAGTAETLLIIMQQHNVKEENVFHPMCDQRLADQLEALLPELQKQLAEHESTST
nr:hemerythrin domain-containing protein [Accumulibacter sp.]